MSAIPRLILIISIITGFQNANAYPGGSKQEYDSTITNKQFHFDGFLATSLILNNNWKETDHSSLIFAGSINIFLKTKGSLTERLLEFRSELNYQKFIDSIWVKNTDRIFFSSIWTRGNKKYFHRSVNVILKTQITDTWKYSHDKRKWQSGPLVPFTLMTGYGLNLSMRNGNYLNVAIVSVKLNSKPKTDRLLPDLKVAASTDKVIIYSEYGLNIQGFYKKKLSSLIYFENTISFFSKGFDKKMLTFEIQNIIALKPFRQFKIRLTNDLIYDYLISEKLQSRYELLLGFNFENKQ